MKKNLLIFALIAVMLISLVGCGGGKVQDSGSQSNGTEEGGEQVVDQGEKIVRINQHETPILDPAIGISNASAIAFVNIYDSLVFPTQDGVIPWLAESWQVSEDGKEYTFYLKKGVKFHDGSELLASDVVFSMKRLLTIGEGYAYLYKGIVEDVTAVDDYTVKFTLTKPFGPFVDSLCRLYILNEDVVMANKKDGDYGEFGDYGRDFLINGDAGSGPFMPVELVQQDYFYAKRFDDWHMGWDENAPEAFKIIYASEASTVRTMLENNQLEITDQWQTKESLEALSKLDGVEVTAYSTRLVQNVFYNTTLPPTDDLNFRKALSCLFDYDMIVNTIFVDSEINYGPVSNFTAGHVRTNRYEYNLEKAKEYLNQSKYKDNYQDYEVEFLVNSDFLDIEKLALAFQSAAKQVGINVKITKAPWVTIQERVSNPDTTPHTVSINSGPQYNEAGATLESGFHSKTAGTYENCHWYITDELDKEIEDALATVDRDERFKKYADLQNKIVDEICPAAWVADLTERVAYRADRLEWPAGEAYETGNVNAYLMGYPFFVPDMRIK